MTFGDSDQHTGVRYQPDERPPTALACGLGLQLAILCAAGIVLTPAIVVRAAGGTEAFLTWAVFAAVAVSGVSTVLQAVRVGRIGAGYVLAMGHLRGVHRDLCRNACHGWSGDARHAGRHFVSLPVRRLPGDSRCSGGS